MVVDGCLVMHLTTTLDLWRKQGGEYYYGVGLHVERIT